MKNFLLFLFILLSFKQAFSQKKVTVSSWEQIQLCDLADSLQEATYKTYLSSDKKYFMQDNGGETRFHYWWNAHTLDALVDGYLRTKDTRYINRMKSLIGGIKDANNGTYFNDFYDDMEWLALASLRAYQATKDNEFLEVTHTLWTDIKTALNDTMGGGFAWRKSQTYYKNTPANAPAIILASRLYLLEKQKSDLQLAEKLYAWLKRTLVDSSTGFVMDGINREKNGQIDHWKFTYNQGVFIGAGLELYHLTENKNYLNDAIKTADNVLNDPEFVPGGILKSEGNKDGGLFKGIFIRYLALLSEEKRIPKIKRKAYVQLIQNNALTLANKGIKRPEMLVGDYWANPPENNTDLSTQLSGIMLIEAACKLNIQ